MVSEGDVSLIYRIFAGGVSYCKATSYNPGGAEFTAQVSFKNGTCDAEITIDREASRADDDN